MRRPMCGDTFPEMSSTAWSRVFLGGDITLIFFIPFSFEVDLDRDSGELSFQLRDRTTDVQSESLLLSVRISRFPAAFEFLRSKTAPRNSAFGSSSNRSKVFNFIIGY
jgi:hypothetical protein